MPTLQFMPWCRIDKSYSAGEGIRKVDMNGLEEVLRHLRVFVAERDWQQFHDPKNLAMAISSEAGELLAEYRWITNDNSDEYSRRSDVKERVTTEAADVGISLLLFCERVEIDLVAAMQQKIAQNEQNYPAYLSRGRSDRPI